jgi:myosin-5
MGLLCMLEEQCKLPKGSDPNFVDKLHSTKSSALVIKKKRNPTEFSIAHYAGEVTYDATGFLVTNLW